MKTSRFRRGPIEGLPDAPARDAPAPEEEDSGLPDMLVWSLLTCQGTSPHSSPLWLPLIFEKNLTSLQGAVLVAESLMNFLIAGSPGGSSKLHLQRAGCLCEGKARREGQGRTWEAPPRANSPGCRRQHELRRPRWDLLQSCRLPP